MVNPTEVRIITLIIAFAWGFTCGHYLGLWGLVPAILGGAVLGIASAMYCEYYNNRE